MRSKRGWGGWEVGVREREKERLAHRSDVHITLTGRVDDHIR